MSTPRSQEDDIALLLREKYNSIKTDAFLFDVKRIEAGEPLDYVFGYYDFLGCHIDLSYEPLIPRSETEFWVELVIKEYQQKPGLRCLDMFSGSGCIGIALAKHLTNSTVDFSEIDAELILQIKKNLRLNSISSTQSKVYQSDCFKKIPKNNKYDLIVANPPYVAYDRSNNVTESVRTWEPQKAVFAAGHGFQYIHILISEGWRFLSPHGVFFFEFDEPQHEALEELLKNDPHFEAHFFKDQYGRWRYAKLVLIAR